MLSEPVARQMLYVCQELFWAWTKHDSVQLADPFFHSLMGISWISFIGKRLPLRHVANVASAVWSPYFSLFYLFLLSISHFGLNRNIIFVNLVLILCLNAIPATIVWRLKRAGKVSDMHVTIHAQRRLIYAVLIVCGCIGGLILTFFSNLFGLQLWLSLMLCAAAVALINQYWKISAHAASMGVLTVWAAILVGADAFIFFGVGLLITMWARTRLRVHSTNQVFVGAAVGISSVFVVFALTSCL